MVDHSPPSPVKREEVAVVLRIRCSQVQLRLDRVITAAVLTAVVEAVPVEWVPRRAQVRLEELDSQSQSRGRTYITQVVVDNVVIQYRAQVVLVVVERVHLRHLAVDTHN